MLNDEKYTDADKWLVDVLKSEPNFVLPDNFADRMAEKMSRKFAWSLYLREFAIYAGAILGVIAVLAAVHIFLAGADWKSWTKFVGDNLVMVIAAAFLLLFVLFTDRVLLRYFLHRSKIDPF
jgi:sterol desaturase/sphingolipid hydroxylase (fatty acid hydroxylase superfamily)